MVNLNLYVNLEFSGNWRESMKRQIAAILYADAVGYSRLTGLDEEKTHQMLSEALDLCTSMIKSHGGRKVNEAGDALLAEFSSVVMSVNCATDFQLKMETRNADLAEKERLVFRIGINLGEVIEDRNDIYGDGVNLAARIQELADPGGVCISSSVYEQVAGKVSHVFDDLGYRKVKNIAQSVHVYRVHCSDRMLDKKNQPSHDFENHAKDKSTLITGGCQCGDIRYEIDQPASGTGVCHCRMCQRAIGASFDAWAAFPREAVRFTCGKPKYYKSSLIGKRGFCANCGSSLVLSYYAPKASKLLIMMAACLDTPEDFAPGWHGGTESQMPWLDIRDDLPRKRCDESADLHGRWGAVGVPNPAHWK
jgi:class 3 adenylate cyclase